jgi:hypothetical protein
MLPCGTPEWMWKRLEVSLLNFVLNCRAFRYNFSRRNLLKKLIFPHLGKKMSALYETRYFITVLHIAHETEICQNSLTRILQEKENVTDSQ